ncbi:MAG: hypothetical protein B7Z72_10870 [Gemmatimonadetes bacterium 21-71-4]|nr:MAG: hypothetical protein B7Z72_10870 [Gemmatimonadetes bacterium 21-71-4]
MAVDHVPVGRSTLSFVVRRARGRITLSVRRSGDRTPVELVFSPALPLGAHAAGTGVTVHETLGDVHATVRTTLVDSATLGVSYSGGWSIVPPEMPPMIGDRSKAPRVLSERLAGAGANYVVSLEGLAGRTYGFRVMAPGVTAARTLAASASAGATVTTAGVAGAGRMIEVTFPIAGADADGYTAAVVTISGRRP